MPLADIINPKDQAEYWSAWYPQVPYTATAEQQLQLLRLKEMEEGNLQSPDLAKTSQGGVAAQNQQAMQAPMQVQDGVAQMPPMQAVAPAPAGQGVLDVPQNTGLMDRLGPIPVIGGQQMTPPSLSFPGASMGGVSIPPGVGFSGMQQAPQPGAAPHTQQFSPMPSLSYPGASMGGGSQQAPDRGAAMQQAQPSGQPMPAQGGRQTSVIVEPAPPPEAPPAQKVGWWQNTLTALKDPAVNGPLLTFFGALSAPLAPWETPGSRMARATSLMTMHKNMLTENMRKQPMDREMEQLKLEEAQLDVEGKKSDVKKKGADAEYADKTFNTKVKKAEQDLENAIIDGDLKAEQLAAKKLEIALEKEFGKEKAKAELENIRSQIETRRQTVGIAAKNAETNRINATTPKGGKSLTEMSDAEAMNEINAVARAFRQYSALPDSEQMDQFTWISKTYDPKYLREFTNKMADLQAKGFDVGFRTGANSIIQTPTGATGGKRVIPFSEIK